RTHRGTVSVRALTEELPVGRIPPMRAEMDGAETFVCRRTVAASRVVHIAGNKSLCQRILVHRPVSSERFNDGQRHRPVIRPAPWRRAQVALLGSRRRIETEERFPKCVTKRQPFEAEKRTRDPQHGLARRLLDCRPRRLSRLTPRDAFYRVIGCPTIPH